MTPFSDFMNPYNFVPLPKETPTRQAPISHSSSPGGTHSGSFVCQLHALSPIFIPNQSAETIKIYNLPPPPNRPHLRRVHKIFTRFFDSGDGIPTIPGSSLKGAVRSVAEVLANGCLSIYSEDPRALPDPMFAACNKADNLCPTCRVFGMPAAEEKDSVFYHSKLAFLDAKLLGEPRYFPAPVLLPVLSGPKPGFDNFYKRGGKIRGRKFYYHSPDLGIIPGSTADQSLLASFIQNQNNLQSTSRDTLHMARSVQPLEAWSAFQFRVNFTNLTDFELGLLIYALELNFRLDMRVIPEQGIVRRGIYHKIGYGRPAGLGSAAIEIIQWDEFDYRARYTNMDGKGEVVPVQADNLINQKLDYKSTFFKSMGGKYEDKLIYPVQFQLLECILGYPNNIKEIRYPRRGTDEFNQILPEPCREPARQKAKP